MQETSDFVLFLGRFHPLVVHLPIGILLFAFFLELIGRIQKKSNSIATIKIALLLGAISALFASILGYMLSQSGDYENVMLNNHLWFGVATTVITFLAWAIQSDFLKLPSSLKKFQSNIALLILIVILVSATGHYGGNLTHGSGYLTKYAPFNVGNKKTLPLIASLEEASVYPYLIQPILENKCMSCHNASKQKGGLAMHTVEALLKGGENGLEIFPGESKKSEIFKRVTLPENSEDRMPPEGKTPLTEAEIRLLKFWIDNANADFNSTLANLEVPENIKEIASMLLGLTYLGKVSNDILPKVEVIDNETLKELLAHGFVVKELVSGSNLFDVSLPPNTITTQNLEELEEKLQKLLTIKSNILKLDLASNKLGDKDIKTIAQFHNLRQLQLQENPVGDQGITYLKELSALTSINLYKTNVSKLSLPVFMEMPNLEKVYAWQTALTNEDITTINEVKDNLKIILGL
ncbi:MAG: hypothetical protein QM485_07900 [Flavobacteriaceae bacterium]